MPKKNHHLRDFPTELFGSWKNIDLKKLYLPPTSKFVDRNGLLQKSWRNLKNLIPQYIRYTHPGTSSIIDISCGNGAVLEIMRHLKYEIFGVDYYDDRDFHRSYEPFLVSQEIPHTIHDCRTFPYPIPDQSFDILTCIGAITFYAKTPDTIIERWPKIMDEFARISRKVIAISVNQGWKYRAGKGILWKWQHPEFKLVHRNEHRMRWEK